MEIKRIYHHYEKWEDFINGMWKSVQDEDDMLRQTVEFAGNTELFGNWMRKVITRWPVSCEHNLTDTGSNRRAWIGQAAACLAISSPEFITRRAWWMLTEEQQNNANKEADSAINMWQANYMDKVNNLQQTKLF